MRRVLQQAERAPWCVAQPGCMTRANGVVSNGSRVAASCEHHGRACEKRGMRYTPIPKWKEQR
jgi:hypothetical protein